MSHFSCVDAQQVNATSTHHPCASSHLPHTKAQQLFCHSCPPSHRPVLPVFSVCRKLAWAYHCLERNSSIPGGFCTPLPSFGSCDVSQVLPACCTSPGWGLCIWAFPSFTSKGSKAHFSPWSSWLQDFQSGICLGFLPHLAAGFFDTSGTVLSHIQSPRPSLLRCISWYPLWRGYGGVASSGESTSVFLNSSSNYCHILHQTAGPAGIALFLCGFLVCSVEGQWGMAAP